MSGARPAQRFERLSRRCIEVLRDERAAILAGRFARVIELGEDKRRAVDEVERHVEALRKGDARLAEAERQRLVVLGQMIARRAEENLALLRVAADTAREAADALGATEDATYDAGGRRRAPPPPGQVDAKV